jgi:hypothetical protein
LWYLPGCLRIEVESLRRLYVWLVVPLLDYLAGHCKAMPIRSVVGWVDGELLVAGQVEA